MKMAEMWVGMQTWNWDMIAVVLMVLSPIATVITLWVFKPFKTKVVFVSEIMDSNHPHNYQKLVKQNSEMYEIFKQENSPMYQNLQEEHELLKKEFARKEAEEFTIIKGILNDKILPFMKIIEGHDKWKKEVEKALEENGKIIKLFEEHLKKTA
jgi:hypothetical protein